MGRRQRAACLVFLAMLVAWALVPAVKPARSRGAEQAPKPCWHEPPLLPGEVCPVPATNHPIDPPPPVVTIKVRVPAAATAGQEIEYILCVENISAAPAHHVVVRNALPPNAKLVRAAPPPLKKGGPGGGESDATELHWQLGTLVPGDRRQIKLVLLPTTNEDLRNCARVQFEHGQCVTTRITGAAPPPAKVKTAEPKIKMTMTGPKQQYLNLPAKYFITVENTGEVAVTNLLIANDVPEKMTFVSASEGGKFLANQVGWLLGTLSPGDSKSVSVVLRAQEAGEFCNKAKAIGDNGVTAEAEVCTLFRGASALLFEMVGRQNPIDVDNDTSYPIGLKNTGHLPLTNIRIKAVIPESMAITRAKGPSDHKLGERTPQGQEIIFEALPAIPPGESASYEVYARGMRAGEARFRVEVQADQLQEGGPVRDEELTVVLPTDGPRPAPPGKAPF